MTLVVAKPTHGVVPRLVGMPLERAQRKCERRGLKIEVEEASQGPPGRVVFQLPRPGVAAAPGMTRQGRRRGLIGRLRNLEPASA